MKKTGIILLLTLLILNAKSLYAASFGFGLGPRDENNVPSIGKLETVFENTDTYYIGDTSEKEIYLTFDTGYEFGYTSQILDTLKVNNVNATFFITGDYIEREQELVKRMYDEGHLVGNHTYNHPDVTVINKDELSKEIKSLEKKYYDLTGSDMAPYFRPPRGMLSKQSLNNANELGYINVFWSLAFVDWYTDRQQGYEYSYKNIMNKIHNGAIILLHTVSKDNAEALDLVIKDLRAKGYEFKNLNDLILKKEVPLTELPFLYKIEDIMTYKSFLTIHNK